MKTVILYVSASCRMYTLSLIRDAFQPRGYACLPAGWFLVCNSALSVAQHCPLQSDYRTPRRHNPTVVRLSSRLVSCPTSLPRFPNIFSRPMHFFLVYLTWRSNFRFLSRMIPRYLYSSMGSIWVQHNCSTNICKTMGFIFCSRPEDLWYHI